MEGAGDDAPRPRGIAHYAAAIHGREVHYTRKTPVFGDAGVAFMDRGRRIDIHDWRNRESVLAALQLSQEKWDSITVTGNDGNKAMCASLAAERDFRIVNPELQDSINAQRQAAERKTEALKRAEAATRFKHQDRRT